MLGIVQQNEIELELALLGTCEVVGNVILLLRKTLLQILIQCCVLHYGNILQLNGCGAVICYVVFHRLKCYDFVNY